MDAPDCAGMPLTAKMSLHIYPSVSECHSDVLNPLSALCAGMSLHHLGSTSNPLCKFQAITTYRFEFSLWLHFTNRLFNYLFYICISEIYVISVLDPPHCARITPFCPGSTSLCQDNTFLSWIHLTVPGCRSSSVDTPNCTKISLLQCRSTTLYHDIAPPSTFTSLCKLHVIIMNIVSPLALWVGLIMACKFGCNRMTTLVSLHSCPHATEIRRLREVARDNSLFFSKIF